MKYAYVLFGGKNSFISYNDKLKMRVHTRCSGIIFFFYFKNFKIYLNKFNNYNKLKE